MAHARSQRRCRSLSRLTTFVAAISLYATAIATLMIMGAWCVWYNRYSRGVVTGLLARKPVTFPEVLDAAEPRPGAVCYRPATPLTFIRTERGVALNLASRQTQVAGLYLCGLIVLIRL